MNYMINVLTLYAIFAGLGVTFNWLQGYGGLFSISQAAFMGLGGYLAVGIMMTTHLPVLLVALMVLIGGAMAGAVLGATAVRVSGIYLVIASFGFQVVGTTVFTNSHALTGADQGRSLPAPFSLFGLATNWSTLIVSLLATLVLVLTSFAVARSRAGLIVHAIRSDELAAQSCGWNVALVKVGLHGVTLGAAAVMGMLYALSIQYVAPEDFSLSTSIEVLAIVAIGGMANSFGPLLGAVMVVGIPQLLTYTHLPPTKEVPLQQAIYGVILVILMVFRRNGLLNEDYKPKGAEDAAEYPDIDHRPAPVGLAGGRAGD